MQRELLTRAAIETGIEKPRISRAVATRFEGLERLIVKRAAQFLGHRVEVRSAIGRGSCFVVAAKRSSAGPGDGEMPHPDHAVGLWPRNSGFAPIMGNL